MNLSPQYNLNGTTSPINLVYNAYLSRRKAPNKDIYYYAAIN